MTFIAPLVVTILSAVLLAEKVGLHRWSAIIAGFAGTAIVIRPGFENFHPALLLVSLAAILFDGRQIISRLLSSSDNVYTTVAYTALQIAHAGLVAPVQYTILIWGTIYGLILFADIPDVFTFIGAAIIIASGLYTIHRERLRQADKPADEK